MKRPDIWTVALSLVLAVVGLWGATSVFGPALVLRFATMTPAARDRMQEIYNEEDRVSALVREGVQVSKPMREEVAPVFTIHRLACPAPLVLDVEIFYSAHGKRKPVSAGTYCLTPWRVYLLEDRS
jgi:hypothetical protein